MLDKIKEYINENKKNIIIAIVLFIVGFVSYNVWSAGNVSDNGTTADQIKSDIRSTGNELNRAGQAITNSQSISSEIRRTNQNIEQSNKSVRQSIETSQSINKSSHDLIREGQQILRELPTTDQK